MRLISWRQADRRTRRASRIETYQPRDDLRMKFHLHLLAYQGRPQSCGSHLVHGGGFLQRVSSTVGALSLAIANGGGKSLSDASFNVL